MPTKARQYSPRPTRHARIIKQPRPRDRRPSACKRGYGRRWQKLRLWQLNREPLCRECRKDDTYTGATVADHIVPHKGDPLLMWDTSNLQSLCDKHHNAKSARERHEDG